MGRMMPTHCPHGKVMDWGDFGPDDEAEPQPCEACDARPTVAESLHSAIDLYDQAIGLLGEARHTLAMALDRLEGAQERKAGE